MTKMSAGALLPLSFWAVAKLEKTRQVVIKLNDLPPVLMGAEEAREFVAALEAELRDLTQAPPVQPLLKFA